VTLDTLHLSFRSGFFRLFLSLFESYLPIFIRALARIE